jgi:hypothetical protein
MLENLLRTALNGFRTLMPLLREWPKREISSPEIRFSHPQNIFSPVFAFSEKLNHLNAMIYVRHTGQFLPEFPPFSMPIRFLDLTLRPFPTPRATTQLVLL